MQCPTCLSECAQGEAECRACGSPLPARPASRRVRIAGEGERKQVTVLFADITGSTGLIAGLDPELAASRLEPILRTMVAAVHRFDGTVNRVQGDGIMALFGATLAHEDHAVRACYAALEMHRALEADPHARAGIRVGLNSGEVVVRPVQNDVSVDYDAVGAEVHLAARMEQLAEPGATYMTAETFRLSEDWIEAQALGPLAVKGVAHPVAAYRLLGRRTGQTRWETRSARGLLPMVGRAAELATLQDAAAEAEAGRGSIVAIAGEPGIGKSRLAHAFSERRRAAGWTVLKAAAAPHGGAGIYQPLGALLRSWLGLDEREGEGRASEALRRGLGPEGDALRSPLHSLLDLPVEDAAWTGLDPPARRERVLEALTYVLRRIAESGPVLALVEDLHWIDSGTLAALDAAAQAAAEARLLLVVTHRPEFRRDWPSGVRSHEVRLGPLERAAERRLLDLLLGTDPELAEVKALIAGRAEGTPLFLEETTRALVETGALAGEPGRLHATRPVATVDVPPTVQAVLAARIDRLPPDEKALLQLASVLGREAPADLLRRLAEPAHGEVAPLLARLQAGDFLAPTPTAGGASYGFTHALTQEVAYTGLLLERRRSLHRRALDAIEAGHGGRDGQIERLAFHAAGAEVWDKAVGYLRRAGMRAIERSAYREAIGLLERALEALARMPETVEAMRDAIDIRLSLRTAFGATVEIGRLDAHLQVAGEIAERLGDRRRLAAVNAAHALAYNLLGRLDRAIAAGTQARAIARELGDRRIHIASSLYLAQAHTWLGEPEHALRLLDPPPLDLLGELRHERIGTTVTSSVLWLGLLCATRAYLGAFESGLAAGAQAQDVAEEGRRPYDIALAAWYRGFALAHRGDAEAALAALERSYAICRGGRIHLLAPIVTTSLGYAYALLGRLEEADSTLQATLAQWRRTGLEYGVAWAAAHLSLAKLLSGQLEEARRLAEDAAILAEKRGYRGVQAAALRLLGSIEGAAPAPDFAAGRRHIEASLQVAEAAALEPDVAHAQLALGRLLDRAGVHGEAGAAVAAARRRYAQLGMSYWASRARDAA